MRACEYCRQGNVRPEDMCDECMRGAEVKLWVTWALMLAGTLAYVLWVG